MGQNFLDIPYRITIQVWIASGWLRVFSVPYANFFVMRKLVQFSPREIMFSLIIMLVSICYHDFTLSRALLGFPPNVGNFLV